MKFLTYNRLPRWYGLSWDAAQPAILLRVHRELADRLEPIKSDASIVEAISHELKLTTFIGDFRSDFGFHQALIRLPDDGQYVTFRGELPKVRYETEARCLYCRGRKKDLIVRDEPCFNCDGTGKEHEYKWRRSEILSASLGLLFMVIGHLDEDFVTTATEEQLLTVHMSIRQGYAPIGGMYSIPLVTWFQAQTVGEPITKMVAAMRQAYAYMMGESRAGQFSFRASVDYPTGWLNVSVPGDGCGIHPSHGRSPQPGEGYEFVDHNTDQPAQQLSMLAGLAALHDLVDKELHHGLY